MTFATGFSLRASSLRSQAAEVHARSKQSCRDSTKGWVLDHFWPHYRVVLSPVAILHGYLFNSRNPTEEHINEGVHWSVVSKRTSHAGSRYKPPNLPEPIPTKKVATITDEERVLIDKGE
jgi:hypothetical protein